MNIKQLILLFCIVGVIASCGKDTSSLEKKIPELATTSEISGGAWLTKKGGDSEIIRGMKIYLLEKKIPNRHLINSLTMKLQKAREQLEILKKELKEIDEERAELPETAGFMYDAYDLVKLKGLYDTQKKSVQALIPITKKLIPLLEQELSEASKINNEEPVDLKRVYQTLDRTECDSATLTFWSEIIRGFLLKETSTDINGTYQLPYNSDKETYVYACYETEYYVIDWLIPLEAGLTSDTTINLQNSNAILLHNK